jgi:hypothetical protein
MKKYLIFILILVNANCFSQENNLKNSNNSDSTIRQIRKVVYKINSDTTNQTVSIESIAGESAEGGELKKFYFDNKLCKAIAIFYGETGKRVKEYYFFNGLILFLYEREEHYTEPIYDKNSEVNRVIENRFYFNSEKLIRWKNGDKIMDKILYPSKKIEIENDLKDLFKKA